MEVIKKVWQWINAFVLWLRDAWRLWPTRCLSVVLLVIVIGSQLPGKADDRVRYCGLALQLLGILTVVHGLVGKRRLFNHPGIVDDFRAWLGRFPRWGAKPRFVELSGEAVISLSGSGRLSVWRGIPPEASLEDRLSALQANLETLKTELAESATKLQEEIRKLIENVNSERRMRESAVEEVRNQIKTLGTGGLRLEWTGVLWLLLGTILVTIPSEIAGFLKWFQ